MADSVEKLDRTTGGTFRPANSVNESPARWIFDRIFPSNVSLVQAPLAMNFSLGVFQQNRPIAKEKAFWLGGSEVLARWYDVVMNKTWAFFVSSVWIFVGLSAYRVILHILQAEQIIGSYAAGYDYRILIAPFFLLGFELFLWFKMFRYAAHPSRIFAGIIGAYILLMIVFVNLVVADMNDIEIESFMLLLYAYTGIGHFFYALFGRETRY